MLKERFTIGHTTLQVDHAPEELLSIRRRGAGPSSERTTWPIAGPSRAEAVCSTWGTAEGSRSASTDRVWESRRCAVCAFWNHPLFQNRT